MKYVASFDIGTTQVKGVLVSTDQTVVCSLSKPIETVFYQDTKEQRPEDWYTVFCQISREFFAKGYRPEDILGIIMSGQMQDLITVDQDCLPVMKAILYSDSRANKEAVEIQNKIGLKKIMESTGNHFDGSMPLAKLLWIKKNNPVAYKHIYKILISSKDYCIARLTGQYITDVVSASTAGLMDIYQKKWNVDWLAHINLNPDFLPKIKYAEDLVGNVTKKAALESGYSVGTPVYAGSGDAGSTTLASGISKEGEFNINIGTSGWIAGIDNKILQRKGVFNLAAILKDKYINVVPFLNAGGVHNWISKTLTPDNDQENRYAYLDKLLTNGQCGSHGLIFLPYLVGERFPVMDEQAKGCFLGISAETTKSDLARASLAGVAFSIRQGLEAIGKPARRITLIGGGAKVKTWCQIFADVLGKPVFVVNNAEYMPSISLAASVFIAQNLETDYHHYISTLIKNNNFICYHPIEQNVETLDRQYLKYIKIYPRIKALF